MDNREQTAQHLKFSIAYSFWYEKFMYKFFGRLDKLAALILMLVAICTVAGLCSPIISGLIITIVVFFQLTIKAGVKSQSAKAVYQEYKSLYLHFDDYDIEELKVKFSELNLKDTDEVDALAYPARLAALAMLGMTPANGYAEVSRNLNVKEQLILLFIGERIEYEFSEMLRGQIISASLDMVKDNNAMDNFLNWKSVEKDGLPDRKDFYLTCGEGIHGVDLAYYQPGIKIWEDYEGDPDIHVTHYMLLSEIPRPK
ncbi:hypothetical protein [Snodgrassella alvi]|uniref:hypothetical protein n=1 Tax=Snodgrassella alvi TaxID=1196083 RepID=UPI000C1E68A4|nr:hypothetical protein [Snodgrassella alvi]PIT21788.1 hypothetical protein BGI34_00850 [Snodgrassella alvi]